MMTIAERIRGLTGRAVEATTPIADRIRDLSDKALGVTRYEKPKPVYSLKDRGVDLDENDMGELRNVLYAEISNRDPEKQKMESRAIVNTALNRIPQYKEKGKTLRLSDVLREKNQYQGYNPDDPKSQYMVAKSGKGNAKKLAAIDEVLNEIKGGEFKDTTDGKVFYVHEDDGRITLKDGKLYQ